MPPRIFFALFLAAALARAEEPLKVAIFDLDATPPIGSALTYDPMRDTGELGLRCRGVALLGSGQPMVVCAVDWIGVANEGHDAFRDALAKAVGTTRERVAVHALHQHDAPICDFSAETLLKESGRAPAIYDGTHVRAIIARAAETLQTAIGKARPVTHTGFGVAEVKEVASNRRIMGPDGKVRAVRYTATKDPALRAEPEGTIDPQVSLLSFWNGDEPLAILSYYATHPQSYYRTGSANPDFPGIARFLRGQAEPRALHVHFAGAGGNIGAGKYNDGSITQRPILAQRVADGMSRAWTATEKTPITAAEVGWQVEKVVLPPAEHLSEEKLRAQLASPSAAQILGAAPQLAWLLRCRAQTPVDIACLRVGKTRVLHLPGELFVEYQLAAKQLRPDLQVAMAAYGQYGPGYIGTEIAYGQGGYETEPRSSFVAPAVEGVLMGAIRKLLDR